MSPPFLACWAAVHADACFLETVFYGAAGFPVSLALAIICDHRNGKRAAARHAGRHWSGLTRSFHPINRPLVRAFKRERK